jgi:hypothetical protein
MKKRISLLISLTVVILFINIYITTKNKSVYSFSLNNIEAIAAKSETYTFHEDCILDIANDTEGDYSQKSCDEKSTDTKIYACKKVTTSTIASTNTGVCYTIEES